MGISLKIILIYQIVLQLSANIVLTDRSTDLQLPHLSPGLNEIQTNAFLAAPQMHPDQPKPNMLVNCSTNDDAKNCRRLPRSTPSNLMAIFPGFRKVERGPQNMTELKPFGSDKKPSSDAMTKDERKKREMQVIMTRYRKGVKKRILKRKMRPKPTSRSRSRPSKDDDCVWEHEERTTVMPRVPNPLPMSGVDMEFVYAKKPKMRTRIESVMTGWNSESRVTIDLHP